jgi:hypothetical protein
VLPLSAQSRNLPIVARKHDSPQYSWLSIDCFSWFSWLLLLPQISSSGTFSRIQKGFDHGVGHPLVLLYDAKAPNYQKSRKFKGLGHYPSNTASRPS